eukprot:gene28023-34815_t
MGDVFVDLGHGTVIRRPADDHCEITVEEGDILAEDDSTFDWTRA